MDQTYDASLTQKWPPVSAAQANAISTITDPARRNLRITQAYHDLTIALTRHFGAKNVTWCAYATWASKGAGAFIRGEEAPRIIHELIENVRDLEAPLRSASEVLTEVDPDARIDRTVLTSTIEDVLDDVTKYIGQGNLIVFQELAPLYAAFLETWKEPPAAFEQAAIDAFIASHFKPGPLEKGGQDLLIQAFRVSYDAMFEKDSGRKAQQMFLANALVGYHEQTRLQGPIVAGLNAPIADALLSHVKRHGSGGLSSFLRSTVEAAAAEMVRPLTMQMEKAWHHVSTRFLMSLTLPNVTLDLSDDVPRFSPVRMFPPELERATFPPLYQILARLDRTPDTVAGSAAHDWGKLGDRMNFIVDFFRTRQQDQVLYTQPFTDAQVAVILEGGMPSGKL